MISIIIDISTADKLYIAYAGQWFPMYSKIKCSGQTIEEAKDKAKHFFNALYIQKRQFQDEYYKTFNRYVSYMRRMLKTKHFEKECYLNHPLEVGNADLPMGITMSLETKIYDLEL